MSRSSDLSEIDATIEEENVTFDFWFIGPTLTIADATISIQVYAGQDTNVNDRILGARQIIPSPRSLLPDQAVIQKFGGMIGGVTYTVSCLAVLSDGQKKNLYAHWPCKTPR